MLEATSEFVLRVEAEVENVSETVVLDLSKHFVKYEFSLDLPDNKGGQIIMKKATISRVI